MLCVFSTFHFYSMANTKSAQKNIRKTEARTSANRVVTSRLKTLAKKVQQVSTSDDKETVKKVAAEYVSALDKAAKRGIIHPNNASRRKSALAGALQS